MRRFFFAQFQQLLCNKYSKLETNKRLNNQLEIVKVITYLFIFMIGNTTLLILTFLNKFPFKIK
jgi:hypothetical protein